MKFVIHIKEGIYVETAQIPIDKRKAVLLDDGMSKSVITRSLNLGQPGFSTYNTLGDRFVARGLRFLNTFMASDLPFMTSGLTFSCFVQILGYVGINYNSPTLGTAMLTLVPGFTFILAIIFKMEKLKSRSISSLARSLGTLMSITGEFYLSIVSDMLGCTTNFSKCGVIEIEEKWDKVTTIFLPTGRTLTIEDSAPVIAALLLENRGIIGDFIKGVFSIFHNLDFGFLEMNPFTRVNGEPHPLGSSGKLDEGHEDANGFQTTLEIHLDWFTSMRYPRGRVQG